MSTGTVMSMRTKGILAGLAAVTAAVIGILTSFSTVHWSTAQTSLVIAEAAAFWAFVSALVAHLTPGSKQQHVAVGGTLTALATATVSMGIGFSWGSMNQTQGAYITSLVAALVAVGTAMFARTRVEAKVTGEEGEAAEQEPSGAAATAPGHDGQRVTRAEVDVDLRSAGGRFNGSV